MGVKLIEPYLYENKTITDLKSVGFTAGDKMIFAKKYAKKFSPLALEEKFNLSPVL